MGKKERLTAAMYSAQLQRLSNAIREKRQEKRKVILQHDNARIHVAKLTKQTVQELDWEVLYFAKDDAWPKVALDENSHRSSNRNVEIG